MSNINVKELFKKYLRCQIKRAENSQYMRQKFTGQGTATGGLKTKKNPLGKNRPKTQGACILEKNAEKLFFLGCLLCSRLLFGNGLFLRCLRGCPFLCCWHDTLPQ